LSYREPWWLVWNGKESDETAGSGRRDGVKVGSKKRSKETVAAVVVMMR
jgi:hypothetical protein